jgi:hypothetical protein
MPLEISGRATRTPVASGLRFGPDLRDFLVE